MFSSAVCRDNIVNNKPETLVLSRGHRLKHDRSYFRENERIHIGHLGSHARSVRGFVPTILEDMRTHIPRTHELFFKLIRYTHLYLRPLNNLLHRILRYDYFERLGAVSCSSLSSAPNRPKCSGGG